METLILLAAGAVAGTTAGLLGIGGGIVIVPVLTIVFQAQGVDPEILIKTAIGTSLATIVVTASSSIMAHQKKGAVDWDTFQKFSPGVVVGTILGALLADIMPGEYLYIIFTILLFVVAAVFSMGRESRATTTLPESVLTMGGVSTVVGIVSALMGVGGGSMTVPFLTYCSVPVKRAIATSAAVGLPIAIVGAVSFMITGFNEDNLPAYSFGYINLVAFLGIVASSTLFAPLGAKLAHRLPDKTLKQVFAVFLLVLGARMVYGLI